MSPAWLLDGVEATCVECSWQHDGVSNFGAPGPRLAAHVVRAAQRHADHTGHTVRVERGQTQVLTSRATEQRQNGGGSDA